MLKRNQLDLDFVGTNKSLDIFRPIHYIGSKFRMLNFINDTVNEVDPSMSRVCDLFAGSGTVSFKLSKVRPVLAVDIQEYSKIICSAVLEPSRIDNYSIELLHSYPTSITKETMQWISEKIVKYEDECIVHAIQGDAEPLAELIEHGSIVLFEKSEGKKLSPNLKEVIFETSQRLKKVNYLTGPKCLMFRYYGGVFFSYRQAVDLDLLLNAIHKIPIEYRNTFLAAILSTASEVVNTVGKQFAQPLNPRKLDGTIKPNLAKRMMKDRNLNVMKIFQLWLDRYLSISKPKYHNIIFKMDYLDALDSLPKDTGIIYADPPYTRDHYSRFYHLLETLALQDSPNLSTMKVNGKIKISKGLYREERYQSPFCIKSQVEGAFESLFKKIKERELPLVLSYSPYDVTKKSRPRLLTIDQLLVIAKIYFKEVKVISPGLFSHSKLNQSKLNFEKPENSELILICKN